MGSLLVPLLPFIIGSALVPVQNIINILLLKNPRQGLLKASAYVGGLTILRLLQGLVFGLVFAKEHGGEKSPVVLTLQLVLGILLLITAYKKWRNEEDPDAPPPKWMTMIDSLTPLKAFGIGFAVLLISGKLWAFTLSAIGLIAAEQLGQPASILAYLFFVILSQSLLLIAIFFRIIRPEKSKIFLEQASTWLTQNNRSIVMIVSLVFGLLFLYKGAGGFLG